MSPPAADRPLRLAIVLAADEDTCTAAAGGDRVEVGYASFFPRPRTERVAPGHLVALGAGANGRELVVWRWFDAIVLECVRDGVRLWEPGHGEVLARCRDASLSPEPGSRAYASAGLPGAEWWLAGPAVPAAALADVEVAEVERFLTDNDMWSALDSGESVQHD
jgi:hypothetical protein